VAAPGRRSDGPSRRTEILEVAFQQLVAHGFEGLRVRDVAQAVGINQATLLYHFRDKEDLIVSLVDDLIGRFRSVNEGRYVVQSGSFDGFDAHLQTLSGLFVSSPEIYVALNEIAVRAIRHEKIAAKVAAVEGTWADYIGTLLHAAAPDADAEAVAATALATVVFVRGVSAKAAGDGTLATLMAHAKGRKPAARRIQVVMHTYAALVRRGFLAANADEIVPRKNS
jgi:TetR/AcrR family transcriptional repressor of bet genes